MAISRRLVLDAVAGRLAAVTNATGYRGQIGARYGLPGVVGTPDEPPTKTGTDLRVQPYFILEPGVGRPLPGEGSLGGPTDPFRDVDAPYVVRAAAGDHDDLLALVDRIDAVLRPPGGWAPTVAGAVCGPLVPQPGYEPPLLTDNGVTPPRLYVPLQYRLIAHT
ncbi:hypothetical protein [Nocardioides soli]|uniref:DUF3168 domain-containing protein n=1 Tax=Nocardioides soli TaxID=1036020 RepID=A0A7W4Z0W8_9ACTN|nr:hypothetical protein [Nocardioides soli]MBB3041221.1 hypothetical protein [Nocardioides soli]